MKVAFRSELFLIMESWACLIWAWQKWLASSGDECEAIASIVFFKLNQNGTPKLVVCRCYILFPRRYFQVLAVSFWEGTPWKLPHWTPHCFQNAPSAKEAVCSLYLNFMECTFLCLHSFLYRSCLCLTYKNINHKLFCCRLSQYSLGCPLPSNIHHQDFHIFVWGFL